MVSPSRPTSGVGGVGRLPGAPRLRSEGKAVGSPGTVSCQRLLGVGDVLEPVHPQAHGEVPSGRRPQAWSAVVVLTTTWPPCAVAEIRAAEVHVEADQVVLERLRVPGVQPHPHPDGDTLRPPVRLERLLPLGRGSHRVLGLVEHDEEAVALRAELTTAAAPEGGPQDVAVGREDLAYPAPSRFSSVVEPSMSVKSMREPVDAVPVTFDILGARGHRGQRATTRTTDAPWGCDAGAQRWPQPLGRS